MRLRTAALLVGTLTIAFGLSACTAVPESPQPDDTDAATAGSVSDVEDETPGEDEAPVDDETQASADCPTPEEWDAFLGFGEEFVEVDLAALETARGESLPAGGCIYLNKAWMDHSNDTMADVWYFHVDEPGSVTTEELRSAPHSVELIADLSTVGGGAEPLTEYTDHLAAVMPVPLTGEQYTAMIDTIRPSTSPQQSTDPSTLADEFYEECGIPQRLLDNPHFRNEMFTDYPEDWTSLGIPPIPAEDVTICQQQPGSGPITTWVLFDDIAGNLHVAEEWVVALGKAGLGTGVLNQSIIDVATDVDCCAAYDQYHPADGRDVFGRIAVDSVDGLWLGIQTNNPS